MDWTKIIWAIALVAMIALLWPAARNRLKNSPRGTSADWKAALIPLAMVVGFILLLISAVRG